MNLNIFSDYNMNKNDIFSNIFQESMRKWI